MVGQMKQSLFESILENPLNNADLKEHPTLLSLKTTSGFDFYAKRSTAIIYKKNADETVSYIMVSESDTSSNINTTHIPLEFIEEIQLLG